MNLVIIIKMVRALCGSETKILENEFIMHMILILRSGWAAGKSSSIRKIWKRRKERRRIGKKKKN